MRGALGPVMRVHLSRLVCPDLVEWHSWIERVQPGTFAHEDVIRAAIRDGRNVPAALAEHYGRAP